MTTLSLRSISKTFPGADRPAVNGVTLDIHDGEFVALVGPSGCGKSTTLRLIAGLEDPSAGEIYLGERDVMNMSPRERNVAMVFQNYALYPHMTVAKNIAYPLRMRKVSRAEQRDSVKDIARVLQVEELLDRRPGQLSGGQRQRVAMARALVRRPDLFLLDEPLSNLDAQLRVHTRAEISRIQRDIGITTLYVTHDQVEAMTMADRVVVMYDGDLQQFDSPVKLYKRPANLFVAGFIGSPAMNILSGNFIESDDAVSLVIADQTIEFGEEAENRARRLCGEGHRAVYVGIRPKDFRPATPEAPHTLTMKVALIEELGHEKIAYFLGLGDGIYQPLPASAAEEEGPGREQLLRARFPAETPFQVGERVNLAIDVNELHYFDQRTHARLDG